ncbi:MAG: hypothetical protein ACYC5N_02600 [Endomicrobiales bacterium]
MKTILHFLVIFTLSGSCAYAGVVNGTANLVLGQPDFTSNIPTASGLNQPRFVAVDPVNNRVFVTDSANSRVLWWNNASGLASGQAPDGVLGQAVFTSTASNRGGAVGPDTLSHPSGIIVDASGNVWVSDLDNNRVLRFNGSGLANGMAADLVLGQASFTAADAVHTAANSLYHPMGLCFDDTGNLWVADFQNHRILRFAPPFTSSQSADMVLGQKSFTLGAENDSNGDGVTDAVSAATLNYPDGLFVDQAGSVWVADHLNQRARRFSSPHTIGKVADLVLGTPDFLSHPEPLPLPNRTKCVYGVWGDRSGNYWVADTTDNRILRFSGALSNGMNASQVLGQPGFVTGSANRGNLPGPDTLYYPCSVFVDAAGNLWETEWINHRVLKFNSLKVLALDAAWSANTAPREFVVTGEGMAPGTTLKLVKAGRPDIEARNIVLESENRMRGTFDLKQATGGAWDVVAINGDFTGRLSGGLTVAAVRAGTITPARAANQGPVSVTITGENFFAGMTPALTQAGSADITGQNVTFISTTQLTCQFDLTDVSTGPWNVVLPPGNEDSVLADGFQVHFPSSVVRNILTTRSYRLGIENGRGIVVVDIPAGAFAEAVMLSIAEPLSLPPVDPVEFAATEVSVEIKNDKSLPLRKDITITFYYNINAIGGLDRQRLVIAFHEQPGARWLQTNSIAHAVGNNVAARTRHLSIFRVLQRVLKPDLAAAAVYPNPYKPGSGTIFDDTALGKGIVFGDLTIRATIRVFTVTGEQVIEIHEDNGDGVYLWNTENDKNEKVASGVYLYSIVNPDDTSQKRKGTLAIIR